MKNDPFFSCPECGAEDDEPCPGTVRRPEFCLWKDKFCCYCGIAIDGSPGGWYDAVSGDESCRQSFTGFHELET